MTEHWSWAAGSTLEFEPLFSSARASFRARPASNQGYLKALHSASAVIKIPGPPGAGPEVTPNRQFLQGHDHSKPQPDLTGAGDLWMRLQFEVVQGPVGVGLSRFGALGAPNWPQIDRKRPRTDLATSLDRRGGGLEGARAGTSSGGALKHIRVPYATQ